MEGEISLANLGAGVAIEKFGEEMKRVVENILDPNTEATSKREIILRVAFKPTSDRRMAAVAVATQAKLAPSTCFATQAFLGKHAGEPVAFEDNPAQLTIESFVQQAQQQVTTLPAQPAEGEAKS